MKIKTKTIKIEDLWPGDYVQVRRPGMAFATTFARFSHFENDDGFVRAVVDDQGERLALLVRDMDDELDVLL